MLTAACNSLVGNDSVSLWEPDGGPKRDAAVVVPSVPDASVVDASEDASIGLQDSSSAPDETSTSPLATPDASDSGPDAAVCAASICDQRGTVCQDGQTLATCTVDARGCVAVASASTCSAPESCSGKAPAAACSLTCSDSCTQGQTSCTPGGLATCALGSNGCWAYGPPAACGVRQSCSGAAGSAACTCDVDAVCSAVGAACAGASAAVSCAQDGQGCFYQATSSPCTNGACSGGICCTNSCTNGTVSCPSTSSTQLQTCTVGGNGCAALSASACASGNVCERSGGAACVNPNWAEWPMPNDDLDVQNGAPNQQIYSNNGDGTVTDIVTGLVWQQAVPSVTFTWGAASTAGTAQNYCSTLTLANVSDWRLPSIVELGSIVYAGALGPAINTTYFPGTPTGSPFWSSTPYAATAGDAWGLQFVEGEIQEYTESSSLSVRCVR
jgi:Protein of unknown function (DUF1566)